MNRALRQPQPTAGSPFSGTNVCGEAGLALRPGCDGPLFDHDVWDFSSVNGLPAAMSRRLKRMDFTAIQDLRWRLVAKELMFAFLVPGIAASSNCPAPTAIHCT